MLRNVLVGLAILIVAVFTFVAYNSYAERQHAASDEVYSNGAPLSSSPRTAVAPVQTAAPPPTTAAATATSTVPAQTTSLGARNAAVIPAPAGDSIAPNPPNGVIFGGAGNYQLYRQGALTWRLNTDTGETCVLFATDEEWRKPKVYKAGCRGRS